MSTTLTLDSSDVAAAANFLEQFLTDQIPDGDFGRGTALRDLTVSALASVVAFMRADAAQIRQMQSLQTIEGAVGGDSVALQDAALSILSNLFIAPKDGTYARGYAVGHLAEAVDVFIPVTTRFTYKLNVVFLLDSTDTLVIPKTDLLPIVDASGAVTGYEFRIPLVAGAVGPAHNISPGIFSFFDTFNPFVMYVECVEAFSGGKGPETAQEVLARAPTALSVRNLINPRSIQATLQENYDDVEAVLVVGMGDPEMVRDTVPSVAPHLKFHVGGAVDVYLRTGLVETSFTGQVGGAFARPDGVATVFRDASVSFVGVLPGDIIRITDGLTSVPAEFLVVENAGTELIISEGSPFPVATDENSPPTSVSYTIGRVGPAYSDVIADLGGQPYLTGRTSRTAVTAGRITLPGGPVMDILDVAVINPASGEAAFFSPFDGFVRFPAQANATPSEARTPEEGLQFQTIVRNPLFAQTSRQWMEVIVGTDTNPARFDGYSLRVRYRTLTSFSAIDEFLRATRERVSASFQLAKGHHPVSIRMTIYYRLKATATSLIDDDALTSTLVEFINKFDCAVQALDVSTVIALVKDANTNIANIVPAAAGQPLLTISYDLRLPTGDVLTYETADVVEINADKQVAGPSVDLEALGVTWRTLRYIANADDIIVRREGA